MHVAKVANTTGVNRMVWNLHRDYRQSPTHSHQLATHFTPVQNGLPYMRSRYPCQYSHTPATRHRMAVANSTDARGTLFHFLVLR